MDSNFLTKILLTILLIGYWYLLFQLVNKILEKPKLNRGRSLIVSAINVVITFFCMYTFQNIALVYLIMFALMIMEFMLFYKDKLLSKMFCANACILHILIVWTAVSGSVSMYTDHSIAHLSSWGRLTNIALVITFLLLILLIVAVIYALPLDYVRIINRYKEQQKFMNAWMTVNSIYLFINTGVFGHANVHFGHLFNQIALAFAIMIGLYIVLFFAIKSCALLGYKEKNVELQQAVAQEQQYRNSITKDAVSYYEVNLTKDRILAGFEGAYTEIGDGQKSYSEMLRYVSQKVIYEEDMERFMQYASFENNAREFEQGRSEISAEYRRLVGNEEYKWVRMVTNLTRDVESGDLISFVCVKDIDKEKRGQLELEYKAKHDPLTGLYNKKVTGKLINEHLAVEEKQMDSVLFMMDVDNFKTINDNLSHFYGDAVICELADKLQKIFNGGDIVGRIGGDEYMAYMKNCPSIEKIKEKAQEICDTFHIVYNGQQGEKYEISASVGISVAPKNGSTFEELYKCADIALYQAKAKGKNTYVIYNGDVFVGYESNRTEIEGRNSVSPKSFRNNKIEYVFKILYQSENANTAIRAVLELVASHFAFERGYIFETSRDEKTTSNTFEWCAAGIKAEIENLQNLPLEAVATANENFYKNGIFVLKSLDDIKPEERAVLEPQGIKSMFQFGIFDKSQLLGFIGFDNCSSQQLPTGNEIDEIATICNILSTFFVKQRLAQATTNGLLLFQDVMNHLENYIYVVNLQTFEVIFMNEKIRGELQDPELVEPCYKLFRGRSERCVDCPIQGLTDENGRYVNEIYNETFHIWTENTASLLRWRDGSMVGLVNCMNITEQKIEKETHISELEKIVFVDELTGGSTYHKFKEDAQKILDNYPDRDYLVVKFDIDNFKLINQSYSYEKGDEVLRMVAAAVEQTLQKRDGIFARVVKDEFVVLLAMEASLDIQSLYKNFLYNFQRLMGSSFTFRCNFPHGCYLTSQEEEKNIIDMLEKVNLAHKTAKRNKTLDFIVYDKSMIDFEIRQKEIEDKMEIALKNGEFLVYLQPKYSLLDEKIVGAEALVRWKNESKELFYPDAFIATFEQNGFIVKLDFYMLDKVCQILEERAEKGFAPITISVNFSRMHLSNSFFVRNLREVVDSHGVEHKYIEIEITETVIYDNIEILKALLDELHENGFSISMDDFGSGYSSLGMLKNLPVDVIKMDRSFFENQVDSNRSKVVTSSIIQMAENLGIHVVAEGIETKECLELLQELYCEIGQGYYFAKPMPVEDFNKLLAESNT